MHSHTSQSVPPSSDSASASASPATTTQPARIYVGRQTDFLGNSRQLVKHGIRNIAVVLHDGRFYAFDNACYHHGGALLRGDIEDMGGHPCIVCPWHSYRITMDTGEGLYVGIAMDPAGGKPVQAVKSKGKKQRVYPVTVEADGAVYVEFDASGPRVDSDGYAKMAIANQEDATSTPIAEGGLQGVMQGSRLRSGHVFQALHANRPAAADAFGRGGLNPLAGPSSRTPVPASHGTDSRDNALDDEEKGKVQAQQSSKEAKRQQQQQQQHQAAGGSAVESSLMVSCSVAEEVCADVKQFSFVGCGGSVQRLCELGEYVELELPIMDRHTRRLMRRKWTISAANHKNTLFSVIVKRKGDHGGSAWLHQFGLHVPLRVCGVGGTLTLVDHQERIRAVHGQVLWLSAGIGITSAYANAVSALTDDFFVYSSTDLLRLVHLHTDRRLEEVAKLRELVSLTEQFPRSAPAALADSPAATKSYTLTLFLTKEEQEQEGEGPVSTMAPGLPVRNPSLDNVSATASDGSGASSSGGKRSKKDRQSVPLPSLRELVGTRLAAHGGVVSGRRCGFEDIAAAVAAAFEPGTPFLAYVCGPTSFVGTCTNALLSLGVSEADILTDDP